MTTESQRYSCFTRNGENVIPKYASPEAKGSNPTTGLPCSGPVTHSREILTTGKSHGKKNPRVRNMQKTLQTLKYQFNKGATCWFLLYDYITVQCARNIENIKITLFLSIKCNQNQLPTAQRLFDHD